MADQDLKLEERLSPCEIEVLRLIATSHSTKEIAKLRGRAVKTISTQRESLMRKLGIHDVSGLTRYALGSGMVRNEYDPEFVFGLLNMAD